MIVISARHLLLDIALCLGSLQKPFSCCPHPYIFCLNENERENIYNIDRGFDNRKVRASFPYRMLKKLIKVVILCQSVLRIIPNISKIITTAGTHFKYK